VLVRMAHSVTAQILLNFNGIGVWGDFPDTNAFSCHALASAVFLVEYMRNEFAFYQFF
jgi:hypothetical protein